jgi:hypothetical protein
MSVHDENNAEVYRCKNCNKYYTDHFSIEDINKHRNGECKLKVVNIKSGQTYDIYCGRPGKGQSGYYGNPHPIGFCKICDCVHNRDSSIDSFIIYFKDRINKDVEFKKNIQSLKNKVLGCFCKNSSHEVRCHCDIYIDYLNSPEKYEI